MASTPDPAGARHAADEPRRIRFVRSLRWEALPLLLFTACGVAPHRASTQQPTATAPVVTPYPRGVECRPPEPPDVSSHCHFVPDASLTIEDRRSDCERLCDDGDLVGCRVLGELLVLTGGPADRHRGLQVLADACASEDLEACDALGLQLQDPGAGPTDLPRAFALFRKACEGGHCFACTHVGDLLMYGRGVARDCSAALELYEDICEQGSWWGCLRLGNYHHVGVESCLSRDDGIARELVQRAASLAGCVCAMSLARELDVSCPP